jgi:hypothetical protein
MTVGKHAIAPPRRDAPELCNIFRPIEGAGNAGCLLHPRLACNMCREHAHEHTGTVGASRHSPRNGFTAYAALSPATNSSCHRHRRINGFAAPGWARKTSADLTPATGARTTRFCRTLQRRFVCRACCPLTDLKPALRAGTCSEPRALCCCIPGSTLNLLTARATSRETG